MTADDYLKEFPCACARAIEYCRSFPTMRDAWEKGNVHIPWRAWAIVVLDGGFRQITSFTDWCAEQAEARSVREILYPDAPSCNVGARWESMDWRLNVTGTRVNFASLCRGHAHIVFRGKGLLSPSLSQLNDMCGEVANCSRYLDLVWALGDAKDVNEWARLEQESLKLQKEWLIEHFPRMFVGDDPSQWLNQITIKES